MAMKLKLSWMADLITEAILRRLRVAFEVEIVRFPRIDMKESQLNGARAGDPIIRKLVDDYKTAMENGDAFPRVVGYEGASGFVLLGGNQRCQAIRELIDEGKVAEKAQVEVYVVATTDKFLLDIICRSNNTGHGGRSDREERIANAMHCITVNGMRVADAAKIFVVSSSAIDNRVRAERVRKTLAKEGIVTDGVPILTLAELAKVPDDNVKRNMGHLLATHNPTGDRVKQVVGVLKKAGSQAERLRKVKAFGKELAEEAHRVGPSKSQSASHQAVPRRPRRDELIRRLRQLANFLDQGMDGQAFTCLTDLQIASDSDEAVIRGEWERLQFRMKLILKKKGR